MTKKKEDDKCHLLKNHTDKIKKPRKKPAHKSGGNPGIERYLFCRNNRLTMIFYNI